jgi:hypothetical protein
LLADGDGVSRYLGETSGATFLDHLKHFMLTLVPLTFQPDSGDGSSFVASIGQYQTFDSRRLPEPDGEIMICAFLANPSTNVKSVFSGRPLDAFICRYGVYACRTTLLHTRR